MASFDVVAALRSLDLSDEGERPHVDWLTESTQDAEGFWDALFEHANQVLPLRSRRGKAQDIYYDSVLRHASSGRIAFHSYRRGAADELSFAALDARASAVASVWASRGVAAGASIAVVLPVGSRLAISLAAAIRLGACVSILAPAGRFALERRLAALSPDHIVCEPDAILQLGASAELALPFDDTGPPLRCPPHAYGPEDAFGRLLSPLRSPPLEPVVLPAAIAVENGLRDALFATRIGPGDAVAAPGFDLQQHVPALILSTWLAGAAFVDLPLREIEVRPRALADAPISVLGLSPSLQEILRRNPVSLRRLRHVFRSVDEPLDWGAFTEVLRRNDLARVPSSNLLIDAAAGGCLLISARRPGSASARVLPAPGRPYALLDTAGTGEPAGGTVGVFAPSTDKAPPKDGVFVVAGAGGEMLYGSTVHPRRAARVYPAHEVAAWVGALRGVVDAVVVPVATGDPGARWSFHLLVFTGSPSVRQPASPESVVRSIREELGEDFVPDRVVALPLHPRRMGGKLDFDWCQRQYAGGLLSRKARHSVFQSLVALRDTIAVG